MESCGFPTAHHDHLPSPRAWGHPRREGSQCLCRLLCSRFSALPWLCQPVGQEGLWGEQ